MANRYTRRGFRAQYNPISFEQFAQAPMMAQALHDRTIGDAMAQQEYINNLPWHAKDARRIENELAGQIDNLATKITSSDKGIYDIDPARELANIRTYKREKFAPVQSQIQMALQNRQSLKKRYQDLVDKGDVTSREMQEAMAIFDRQSAQAAGQGTIGYDGRVLAMDPGINKMVVDYISKLPADKIYQETGWKVDPRGVWVNRSRGIEQNGMPDELQAMAMNYIMQDPQAMAYLEDRAMVTEQLYSQVDPESGSIIYNGQYYNPENFRESIIGESIQRAASVARPFSYRNVEEKENIKNLSDYHLGLFGFVNDDFDKYYAGAGEKRPTDFSLDSQIKRVFLDSDGQTMSAAQIDDYIKSVADYDMMSPQEKIRFEKEVVPQLRKSLNRIVQESPNKLSLVGKLFAEDFSGMFTAMKNAIPAWLGYDRPHDNYAALLSRAYDKMTEDGVTHPRLSKENREELRRQQRTKLARHQQQEVDFFEGTDFNYDKLALDKAESIYSQAFENTVTPTINGWAIEEDMYRDANVQEAVKSNNVASLLESNQLMVIDEENNHLYGEDAREWLMERQDVANLSRPKMVTEGVTEEYVLGTSVTITTKDGKEGQVVIPTNSEFLHNAGAELKALAQIEQDYNMTLDGVPKIVPFTGDTYLEYINTVYNGQAVQIIKPVKIETNSDGEVVGKTYIDDGNGNIQVFTMAEFKKEVENRAASLIVKQK